MKCHYCGEEVASGSRYCLCCGTRQEPEESTPVAAVIPEEPEVSEFPVIQVPAELAAPAAPVVAAPAAPAVPVAPAEPKPVRQTRFVSRLQLPTKRGLGKMFFLGILTLGIYPTVIWSRIVTELNIAASRSDGKRTMPYFAMLILTPLTLGIYSLVWMHNFCGRIGEDLRRRRIDYKFGPKTFWLWGVLGSLILVGPFVFTHKLMKSMNQINADFNLRG